jgi:hypothetical protein
MNKMLGFIIGLPVALGLIFLIWLLWTWVVPQLWPSGPEQFTTPNYWLFAGAWFLFVTIARAVRG